MQHFFFNFCNSDLYYKCKCCKDILMQIFLFLVVTKNKTFHRKHHVIDMLYKFPFLRLIKCVTCLVQVIKIWVIQIWHDYILTWASYLWRDTVMWHQYDSSELGEELCPMSSSLPLRVHKLYIRVSFSDTFLRWLPPFVVSINSCHYQQRKNFPFYTLLSSGFVLISYSMLSLIIAWLG